VLEFWDELRKAGSQSLASGSWEILRKRECRSCEGRHDIRTITTSAHTSERREPTSSPRCCGRSWGAVERAATDPAVRQVGGIAVRVARAAQDYGVLTRPYTGILPRYL
jgi:hypothetical protein